MLSRRRGQVVESFGRREGGEWRIARTGYQRLWEEHHKRGDNVRLRVKPIAD